MPPAIVLAGGRGTRLGATTADTPKPLLPVAGKPFLEWVSMWLAVQGVRRITFAGGFRGEQIADWVETTRLKEPLALDCRLEENPLGTGGGILHSIGEHETDVLALNGDSLLLCDLVGMIKRYRESGADAIAAVFEVEDASRFGTVLSDRSGRMTAFGEKQTGSGWVNGGIYIFGPRFHGMFARDKSLSVEYDLFPQALAAGLKVMTFQAPAPFIDIGTPETLAAADDFIRGHLDSFSPAAGREQL
jgi:D-glycero-alpha-D-manno-heptose 1-phosphate guanylyltransferase